MSPRLVDLEQIGFDANGNSYGIKRMVRPEEYEIDVNVLYKWG